MQSAADLTTAVMCLDIIIIVLGIHYLTAE